MIGAKNVNLLWVGLEIVPYFDTKKDGREKNIGPKLNQFTGIFLPSNSLTKEKYQRIKRQKNREKPKSSPKRINQMKGIDYPTSIFFHFELLKKFLFYYSNLNRIRFDLSICRNSQGSHKNISSI